LRSVAGETDPDRWVICHVLPGSTAGIGGRRLVEGWKESWIYVPGEGLRRSGVGLAPQVSIERGGRVVHQWKRGNELGRDVERVEESTHSVGQSRIVDAHARRQPRLTERPTGRGRRRGQRSDEGVDRIGESIVWAGLGYEEAMRTDESHLRLEPERHGGPNNRIALAHVHGERADPSFDPQIRSPH
jgi:hypothetical protein